MPAKKKTARKAAKKPEKSFEESLWETATKLRGSVESSEYKHVVLSLIFLKFVSEKFEERRAELIADGKEKYTDMVEWSGATWTTREGCPKGERGGAHQFYTMQNVFYLPETSRWSYIQQHAKQGDIAIKIDSALTAVEKSNASLKGALPDNYFSRLGLDGSKLSALIDAINNIDTVGDKEEDTDEVRNQNDEGRKRSQGAHQKVFAAHYPTIRKSPEIHSSPGIGQTTAPLGNVRRSELSGSTSRPEQSRVYCEMRRFASGIGRAERSETDWLNSQPAGDAWGRGSIRLLARTPHRGRNRPSGQTATTLRRVRRTHCHLRHDHQTSTGERLKSEGRLEKEETPPLLHSSFSLPTFPTPPTGNANYAWILHMVSKLSDWSGATETTRQGCPKGERGGAHQHGVAGFVLANGSMSTNTTGEGAIRQKMVENDLVDCMIALPGQLFYTTQIPVCLWFLTKNKKADSERGYRNREGETLFIDARKIGSMISRTQKELSAEDIAHIADTYHAWRSGVCANDELSVMSDELKTQHSELSTHNSTSYQDVAGYCKSATLEDMRKHDYVLTPGRYVGAAALEDDGIPFETKMTEMSQTLYAQMDEAKKLDAAIRENLTNLGFSKK
jgi:type I restriction enzyme M protein